MVWGRAVLIGRVQPREDAPGVAGIDPLPVGVAERAGVDVPLCVVEEVARLGIDAAHRADHL
jgi:hypothetical protein